MNSNFQLNEFYAREKMANHLRAAQANRQANQAVNKNSSPANNRGVDRYVGLLVATLVKAYKWVSQERVTSPTLDLTKS